MGRVRRASMRLAEDLAFGEYRVGEVGIVATELSTNLHRHASYGSIVLSVHRSGDDAGLEFISIDRGPGMADVAAVLADGVSSAGTLGIGLGAVRRLSTWFDVHSVQGTGTIMCASLWRDSEPERPGHGAVTRAIRGEDVCGDCVGAAVTGNVETFVLADGLGHGPLARAASAEAVRCLSEGEIGDPESILEEMHRRLRPTRGAAVAIVQASRGDNVVTFAGVGNIASWVCSSDSRRALVSSPGIVGHNIRRIRTDRMEIEPGDLLVMHSDGLTDKWRLDDQVGLVNRRPEIVAASLMRDAGTRHDDASVLVARLA